MSNYIEKAINEANKTGKYVVVCIENKFGKGLLTNDEVYRKVTLNFVPYTTSSGSEGFNNFYQKFLSIPTIFLPTIREKLNISNENFSYEEACEKLRGQYLIIDPSNSEIVDQLSENKADEKNEKVTKITDFELLKWLQDFIDSRDSSNNKNKKQHSKGQRFPKPKPFKNSKGQKHIENEFHLTPHTEFEDKTSIQIKFVSPDGTMKNFNVNKDKKISLFLKPVCKDLGLDMSKLIFTFDARTFDVSKTVRSIHIQNNSVIYSKYKSHV